MSHITAELFCTLDGIVSAPQDWHGPYWVADMGERTEQLLQDSDVMLLGRNTYLEHAGYWPTDTGSMADRMNEMPKLVVSTTLNHPEWQNTTVEPDGLAGALQQLGDRNAVVTGSVALVKSLLALGRLDELRLIVDPVVLGAGTRIFDGDARMPWRLIESVTYPSGAVSLHYGKEATA